MRATDWSPVLRWLVLALGIALAALMAWRHGLAWRVFSEDASLLAAVIAAAFGLCTLHAGYLAWSVSRELADTHRLHLTLRRHADVPLMLVGDRLCLGSEALADCTACRHATRLAHARRSPESAAPLYDALEREVLGRHELGWLLADAMVRLGLLGTVVGFIIMLGSVEATPDIDIAALREVMTGMSGGMRTALLTTLCGLVAGLLLGIQYHVVERGADALLAAVAVATETSILPRLTVPGATGARQP